MLNFIGHITSSKSNEYTINIYNDNYNGEAIELMLTSCIITRGNSDIFDPIISSGCKIEFINNLTDSQLSDLFNIYEKTYRLEVTTIDYSDSSVVTVFKGWLAVDLIEKGIDYQPTISLEFVDYLKKLDEVEPTLLDGSIVPVGKLISNSLNQTYLPQNIVINQKSRSNGTTSSILNNYFSKNYIDSNNLISDNSVDNCKTVVNKLLTPINTYVYSFDNKYYCQSYNDIDNNSSINWLQYNYVTDAYTEVASSKKELVQDTDFVMYAGGNISYESGLKSLTVSLKQKLYNNLVYNNFSTGALTHGTIPLSITRGRWLFQVEGTSYTPLSWGSGYYDIGNYYAYDYSNQIIQGTYRYDYFAAKSFFITIDKSVKNPQNTLNFSATVKRNINLTYNSNQIYSIPVAFRVISGVNKGKYLKFDINGNPSLQTNIFRNDVSNSFKNYDTTVTLSASYNLGSLFDPNGDGTYTDSLFGNENEIEIIVIIEPYRLETSAGSSTFYYNDQLVGNVIVKYTSSESDNQLVASINGNFSKKDEKSLYFFDTPNLNYSNAILYNDTVNYQRTTGWINDYDINSLVYKPLTTRFIESMFKFYSKTRKRISCNIETNNIITPLTILNFGNLGRYYTTKIKHDLFKDEYNIDAIELAYEEINII